MRKLGVVLELIIVGLVFSYGGLIAGLLALLILIVLFLGDGMISMLAQILAAIEKAACDAVQREHAARERAVKGRD
jgi:hypothetical protein